MESKNGASCTRVLYLDILRIIAVFAMMAIHVTSNCFKTQPVNSFNWQVINAYSNIVHFSVPVFVMISGVFFLDNNRPISTKRLFKHNILRIVTAFFFWSLLYSAYNVLNAGVTGVEFIKSLIPAVFYGQYHMWFLFAIVFLYVATPLLRKISADKKSTEYFLLLSFILCYVVNVIEDIPIAGNIVKYISSKGHTEFVLGYTGYFFLGYYLHTYELSEKVKKILYILGSVSLVASIVISGIWSFKTGKAHSELVTNLVPNTCLWSACVFVFFKDKLSKASFKEKTVSAIEKISSLVFGAYLVHDFFNILFKKLNITAVSFNPIFSVPLISLAVFILSFAVSFVISKIPVLKKYII